MVGCVVGFFTGVVTGFVVAGLAVVVVPDLAVPVAGFGVVPAAGLFVFVLGTVVFVGFTGTVVVGRVLVVFGTTGLGIVPVTGATVGCPIGI